MPIELISDKQPVKLWTELTLPTGKLTGIMVIRKTDVSVIGAFVNEFGVRGFDFEITNSQCNINTPLKAMDKWYIKKTLADDFLFMFMPVNGFNQQVNLSSRMCYNYQKELNGDVNAERMFKGKLTARMSIQNDTLKMDNILRNIGYRVSPLN